MTEFVNIYVFLKYKCSPQTLVTGNIRNIRLLIFAAVLQKERQ